jgi:predicted DsbA family dithiol-disulfide isomerase
MRIDIISDVVCPWCFIGKRRLERALADLPPNSVELAWRPFRLNPDLPPEGMDRQAYLQAKFGAAGGGARYRQVEEIGRDEGIPFAFDAIERAPNTLDAHRLIRHAIDSRRQDDMVEALFRAYFVEGRDVGDRDTLAAIADAVGIRRDDALAYLAGDADREAVLAEEDMAKRIGVTGVPCFVIERKYALSGAQPPEAFHEVFEKLASEAADAAP